MTKCLSSVQRQMNVIFSQWPIKCDLMSCNADQLPLTLSKGMPYFLRMDGDISVILWRRKASQPWELPGKKPAGWMGREKEHKILD